MHTHRADNGLGRDEVKTAQEVVCCGWGRFSSNSAGTGSSANGRIQVNRLSYSVFVRNLSAVEVAFTEVQALPISNVGFDGF